jgi:hypothetical protein
MRRAETNEYGQVEDSSIAQGMANAQKPYEEGKTLGIFPPTKAKLREGEWVAEAEGMRLQGYKDREKEQSTEEPKSRNEAVIEAQRIANDALDSGESPKASIAAFLKSLEESGRLEQFDRNLAFAVLDGNTSEEDARKFINGYRAESSSSLQ